MQFPKMADGSWAVNSVESEDWDIYPRPATPYQPNTVGIVIDPMAIHNYAMDDGNPEWSDAEKAKFDLAYAFGSFWCGSTESLQARADQMFNDNGTIKTCLNDSLPLVTGDQFFAQMDIWYGTELHARYGDAEKMPGFQYLLELWNAGQIWDISDKTYPYRVNEDGTVVNCLNEWLEVTNADVYAEGLRLLGRQNGRVMQPGACSFMAECIGELQHAANGNQKVYAEGLRFLQEDKFWNLEPEAISRMVMQDHLETCVVERIQDGDTQVTDEVMSLFKKFM